ncbi:hypothetical protein ABZX40_10100 [Streptomyces sp. NPDC004610]|uniref:hypothetical protein n=1 Tax=unclassified Streptomyces TaxID=2593676 RepID=UPI0033A2C9F4
MTETGPRPLWATLEEAHRVHREHGEPGPGRYGITVTETRQRVWLDAPDGPGWVLVP